MGVLPDQSKLTLGVLTLALAANTSGLGCQCTGLTLQERFDQANAIVQGQAVELSSRPLFWCRIKTLLWDDGEECGGLRATFRVERSWKGAVGERIELTAPFPGDCGVDIVLGRTYLLYLYHRGTKPAFSTSGCAGSAPLEEAEPDMAFLNRIRRTGAPQL